MAKARKGARSRKTTTGSRKTATAKKAGARRAGAPRARRPAPGRAKAARRPAPVALADFLTGPVPDLSQGVIVVLSGGGFDAMNPVEVRERMDEYITRVNDDPDVQAGTGGNGLTFKLFPGQRTKHLHQKKWRDICQALGLLQATPLILVGHSNGGAAAVDLAKCLQGQGKTVDLLLSCDSVLTLDDIGNVNEVPANVKLNINSYVIPTPAWLLAPFPIGTKNRRQSNGSSDGILNVGLEFNLPGAVAHRNAFYFLAGGGGRTGPHPFPFLLLEATLGVLAGRTNDEVIASAVTSLQLLSTGADVDITVTTTGMSTVLHP